MKQIKKHNILTILLLAAVLGGVTTGCKKWEDHNALSDPDTGPDLFQRIQSTPELSRFAELLVKTGYGQLIASSKSPEVCVISSLKIVKSLSNGD